MNEWQCLFAENGTISKWCFCYSLLQTFCFKVAPVFDLSDVLDDENFTISSVKLAVPIEDICGAT